MRSREKKGSAARGRRRGGTPLPPASFLFKTPLRSAVFSRRRVFRTIRLLSKERGVKAYLVGGALRNLYLSRPFEPDIDFVLDHDRGDMTGFAAAVAARLSGKAFLLDKETKATRVVAGKGAKAYTIDFSPIAGRNIIQDLKKRDFTVNATAVEVSSIFEGADLKVIDPCEGLADAKRKALAATNKRVFKEDPLRCLRAIRLSVQYGLTITPGTLARLKASARLLERISVERIRDEILRVFACDRAEKGLKTVFITGLADAALPEARGWTGLKGYDLLTHSLKTLTEAEALLANLGAEFPVHSKRLTRHFSSSIGGVKRGVFFKLCAFFHDIGKPAAMTGEGQRLRFIGHDFIGAQIAQGMAKRLRMSRKAAAGLSSAVKNHHRVFAFAMLKERGARAKAHFFRAVNGRPGVDLVFLAIADARATRGGEDPEVKEAAVELLDFYYGVFSRKRPRPLFTGTEVMRIFGVSQGPLVGEILEGISDAVESGAVTRKKEAVEYVLKRFFPDKHRG